MTESDFMNLNQAAHGDREVDYLQTRVGVARKTVAGHVSNPRVRERIGVWQRAAVGTAAIRSLKLARFGDNMRNVAVAEGDKVDAEIRFGVSVNTYAVNELVECVDAASAAEIEDLIEHYLADYDIAEELLPDGARHESLRYGAAIEVGLRSFLVDGGFGAFTTNFEDLDGLRQLPGLAVQRLMADGYGFGGEGDWKTSVMLHTLKPWPAGWPGAPPSWRTTPKTSAPNHHRQPNILSDQGALDPDRQGLRDLRSRGAQLGETGRRRRRIGR